MRAAGFVLLALATAAEARPQDGSPDRLAAASRDLESNDPKRVFAAVQAIAQLGGASLPLIEARARDAKGRVRDYLELAAEEIRSAPHLPGYPSVKRVSMKSTDKNVVELLAELRSKTGAAFSLENLMDEEKLPELALDVKDATTLETFDAICHAGNVTVSMNNGQFMLYTGTYVDQPRFFYGHYFVRLGDFELVKSVTFRKPASQSFNIQMDMIWDPAAAPLRFKPIRVAEAVDDRGKSLLVPPPPADPNAPPEEEDAGANTPLHLLPPSPAATKITLLRGFTTIVLPKSKATVAFAAPAPEQKAAAGELQARILSIDRDQHEIRVVLESKKHKPDALGKMDALAQVTLKDWESTSTYADHPSWDENGLEVRIHYEPLRLKDGLVRPAEGAPPPQLDRLELSLVTAVQEKRIPFEFRDLKLK
ncbi:MAG: hypothetical protein JO332_13445 [Planctomycetaceae bacterium]|nr:hypothetical protein [Planctomycetaceae bacterium]